MPINFLRALILQELLAFAYISLLPQLPGQQTLFSSFSDTFIPLLLIYVWLIAQRFFNHRIEFACDRDSARLTGDPAAMSVALTTLNKLRSGNLRRGGFTHPATEQRIIRLQRLPGTAPYAHLPLVFRPVATGSPDQVQLAEAIPAVPTVIWKKQPYPVAEQMAQVKAMNEP